MNIKLLYIVVILLFVALSGSTTVFAKERFSEQHRNNVMSVAQELEVIAEKEKELKEELVSVAQEEKDAAKGASEKIEGIEKRGGFKTFFMGTDYKNLGDLRSELMRTNNSIIRLNRSLEKTVSSTTKAEIETQIKNLESVRAEAEAFIKEKEGKFSLVGWWKALFK